MNTEKIFIGYYNDTEWTTFLSRYNNAKNPELESSQNYTTKADFINSFENLNSNQNPLIITVFSHGYPTGITIKNIADETGLRSSLILWNELMLLFNSTRTLYPVTINLLSICNSRQILNTSLNQMFDKLWCTNTLTSNNYYGLLATNSKIENFLNEIKLDDIDNFESNKLMYSEIKL